MLKNLIPIVAACLLLLVVWASSIPLFHWFEASDEPDVFAENLQTWRDHNIESYEYVVLKVCDCPSPANTPIKMVVRDYLNIAAYDDPTANETLPRTIPEVFDLLQTGPAAATSVLVDYDEAYGFPQRIVTGSGPDQVTYTVSDFKVVPGP